MTQREATQRMGVSERWMRALLKQMQAEGDRVLAWRTRAAV
jgi:hypothetical protein